MKHYKLWRVVNDREGDDFEAIGCCLTFLYQIHLGDVIETVQVGGHVGECKYVSYSDSSSTKRESFQTNIKKLMDEYNIVYAGKSIIDNVEEQNILQLSGDNVRDFEFCEKLNELF